MSVKVNKTTANGFTLNPKWGGIFGKDIATPLARIAFVSLSEPSGIAGTTPKYGVSFLVDKNDPQEKIQLKAIQDMYKLMLQDLWGAKALEMVKKFKYPLFRDGDEPSNSGKTYEGFEGKWCIVAKNANPPGHSRGFKLLPPGTGVDQFEAGMICRGIVQPYIGPDGVSYQLRTIKLVKDDGTRYGGAPDPSGILDDFNDAVQAVQADDLDISGVSVL